MNRKTCRTWVLGLGLAVGVTGARASMELAPPPPPPIKIGGFLQSWFTVGDTASASAHGNHRTVGGTLLKRLRLKFTADPFDGVQVVIVPELAGGFALLDGYVTVNPGQLILKHPVPGALTLAIGQFKTPFGLNRMYLPTQLASVDYSTINRGIFGSTSFWDAGAMATLKKRLYRLDFAVVEGLGPNQLTPGGNAYGMKFQMDYLARVELTLRDGRWAVGASGYHGTHFAAPGVQGFLTPRNWLGAHLRIKGGPKTYEVEAEWIKRDQARFGVNGQASYWVLGVLQAFAIYERVEDIQKIANSTGRVGGGFNWLPKATAPVRVTAQFFGESTGPRQKPVNGKGVLQTQVVF